MPGAAGRAALRAFAELLSRRGEPFDRRLQPEPLFPGHLFAIHPVQGPARPLVEYEQYQAHVPNAWRPVKEIAVDMTGVIQAVRVDTQDNVWVVVSSGKPGGVIKLDEGG